MLIAVVFALTLSGSSGQVAVIAATPPPAEARPQGEEATTRRVCRYERATGSNMQQRVCRDVPREGFVQDQQTREFLHSNQRVRLNDPAASGDRAGPGG